MPTDKRRFGLSTKLVVAILAAGAIPLGVGLSARYYRGSSELQDVIGASFQTLAEVSASKVDAKIERLITDDSAAAGHAAADSAVRQWLLGNHPQSGDASEAKFDWQPAIENGFATDEILHASWVTAAVSTKNASHIGNGAIRVVSDLHVDGTSEHYLLQISSPIYGNNKTSPIGWLQRSYDIKELLDPLIYPIRFGDTGHVMLIDQLGTIVSCPLLVTGSRIEDESLIDSVVKNKAGWIKAQNDGHGESVFSIVGHAPLAAVNAFLPASESLHMFVWQDSSEIFAPTRSLLVGVAIAGILSIGLLIAMGYYASRRIVKPIQTLRQEASLIAAGDLSQPLAIKTGDEIEELANEFEKMRIQLRQHIGSLEEKVEERTRKLIESQDEKERVMGQLIQTEKMAAVGTLASGIGHEINNPLYVIAGLAEAIRDENDLTTCNEYGRDILIYGKEISAIVKNLSGYTRPASQDELEKVDVHEKLEKAVSMVKLALLDDRVEIRQNFAPVPKISAQPEEIGQVFFNIIRNGIQAMDGAGTIELTTSLEQDHVCIRIKDNGKGIKTEHLDKIFDPFFTTKGPDEGEGMGMYVVRNIIQKYNGTISLESQEGLGTEFTIQFPVTIVDTESESA
jgi:signal transduction histidine kinase